MSTHAKFILTPITQILNDVVNASVGIGHGIETHPLWDYVMQSVLLKMTGAQEQKMKCICWEMATNDYSYRYDRYSRSPLGECSNYPDKKKVFDDIIKQIAKHDPTKLGFSEAERVALIEEVDSSIETIFKQTNLVLWAQRDFIQYKKIITEINKDCFLPKTDQLFSSCHNCSQQKNRGGLETGACRNDLNLTEIHTQLIARRNRFAHNTLSYQQNLPTLKTLEDINYRYDNYFVFFAILILIDKIFITLYERYLVAREHSWE